MLTKPRLRALLLCILCLGWVTYTGFCFWKLYSRKDSDRPPKEPEEIATLQTANLRADHVAISADGSILASGGYGDNVTLWDVAARKEIAAFPGHHPYVEAIAFSPDGKLLASVGTSQDVRLWDVASGQQIRTFRHFWGFAMSLAFSPDGTRLVTAGTDSALCLHDVASGRRLSVVPNQKPIVWSVAFLGNGPIVLLGNDKSVELIDTSAEMFAELYEHPARIRSVAVTHDATLLASASFDGTVKLWNAVTQQQGAVLRGHTEAVNAVVFTCDDKVLASASEDGTVRLWDVESG